MQYTETYFSPMGEILLASDGLALTGLWFQEQKYFGAGLSAAATQTVLPVFEQTKQWLRLYFEGEKPEFMPEVKLCGTAFQLAVWEILRKIPYGQTTTYGEIALEIAKQRGLAHMSAQAVGGAVGHNPISIIVPCHRVVGSQNSLTGYAGGVEIKEKLLHLERVDTARFKMP